MNTKRKRFAVMIHNGTEHDWLGSFHSIVEIVDWANKNEVEWQIDTHWVLDKDEDAEITMDELMEAWARGERPEDLSMF